MTHVRAVSVGLILMGCLVAVFPLEVVEPSAPPSVTDPADELLLRYNLHPAFEKLGRGIGNTLTGWLEFPLNIEKRYTAADTATSLFTGAVFGIVKSVVRTGVGLYETATFWLPYPERYAPILPTLDYFKRAGTRRELPLLE